MTTASQRSPSAGPIGEMLWCALLRFTQSGWNRSQTSDSSAQAFSPASRQYKLRT